MGIVTKILNENFLAKSIGKITFTSMQPVESISVVFSQGNQIIYPNTSLESLRNSLTVTATYDDDSTREIARYTLTGTLVEGISTITVSYEGHTATFSVTVSHLVVLDSITAVFTQGQTSIYTNTPLDNLKENLVVTANYDDGTYSNVIGADYNLVGTLQVGTSTVTVVYGGKTTTFNVIVSKILPSGYQQVKYVANEGTTGYIELGVNILPTSDKIETTFEPTSFSYASSTFGIPYGDSWGDAEKGIYSFITGAGAYTIRAGGKNIRVASATAAEAIYTALELNTKYNISVFKDTVIVNNTPVGTPEGSYSTAATGTQALFGTKSKNSDTMQSMRFLGRIYSHKIYRNNVLIHNYIPCYRLSDNAIGVYDVIDNVFKPSTGTLSKGSNV